MTKHNKLKLNKNAGHGMVYFFLRS